MDELTGGKPLIVVNTHGHFDHAYGNCQFDTVYCHELEAESIRAQNDQMWDYLFEEDTGRCIWSEFDPADIVPFRNYQVVACKDGTVFDLGGGYEIELVHLGGHTVGHAGYLDKKNRIFFAGDDIISSMHVTCGAKVREYRDRIRKLRDRMGEYDFVYSSHMNVDLENYAVEDLLNTLNAILEDPEHGIASVTHGPRGTTYYKVVEGLGLQGYSLPLED